MVCCRLMPGSNNPFFDTDFFTYFQKKDSTLNFNAVFSHNKNTENRRAKKVVSDSPGLVDFSIGLVNSVFNLPDGQVMFFDEFE